MCFGWLHSVNRALLRTFCWKYATARRFQLSSATFSRIWSCYFRQRRWDDVFFYTSRDSLTRQHPARWLPVEQAEFVDVTEIPLCVCHDNLENPRNLFHDCAIVGALHFAMHVAKKDAVPILEAFHRTIWELYGQFFLIAQVQAGLVEQLLSFDLDDLAI